MDKQTSQIESDLVPGDTLLNYTNSPLSDYFWGSCDQRFTSLQNISMINILVGSTNCGKSRLMRILMNDSIVSIFNRQSVVAGSLTDVLLDVIEQSGVIVLNNGGVDFVYSVSIGESDRYYYPEVVRAGLREIGISADVPSYLKNYRIDSSFINEIQSLAKKIPSADGDHSALFSGLMRANEKLHYAIISDSPLVKVTPRIELKNRSLLCDLNEKLTSLLKLCDGLSVKLRRTNPNGVIHIPTLRTTHTLVDRENLVNENILSSNISTQYNLRNEVSVFSGLELYSQLDRDVRSRRRHELRKFESMLSEKFFNGQGVEIVPEHPDISKARTIENGKKPQGVIAVRIGDGDERPIHTLGDGIQALIMLMYKIYLADPKTWFFIDEPEIGLHPGLQRIFLDCLTSDEYIKSQDHRFFFTTHSNHLLDLTLQRKDISIYSFSRTFKDGKPVFLVRNVSNDRLSALNELGALNSSVLMANCSIWIEGVSDRLYVKKFLEIYCTKNKQPQFQEDIHYAFFEYAGSNIKHYVWGDDSDDASEDDSDDEDVAEVGEDPNDENNKKKIDSIRMQFLSNRVFLIADQDSGKEKKHSYWKEHAEASDGAFAYYCSDGKEIENLLTPEFLKILFAQKKLRPRGLKLNGDEISALEMEHSDYCPGPDKAVVGVAGYFAEKLRLPTGSMQPKRKKDGVGTGTFTDGYKRKISSYADAYLTAENIGEPALRLAKRVYEFIQRHNPRPESKSGT